MKRSLHDRYRDLANGKGRLGRVIRFAKRDLWHLEVAELGRVGAYLTRVSRVVLIMVRGFFGDRCMQQAAALTYLTIFTLPAFLALVFALAKGLGAFETLRVTLIDPFLDRTFPIDDAVVGTATTGSEHIRELIDQVFVYVQDANLTGLGLAGVVFLVYATLKMLSSIERAFNEIWGVQRARSMVRKISDYLAIVLVIPFVLLLGTALTSFLSSTTWLEQSLGYFADVDFEGLRSGLLVSVPLALICFGMTLVLMTLPNTRVHLVPACFGGLLAGIGWQAAQVAFVEFQLGLTRVNAVFSSFAAVPLLLSWIYLSWIVLFCGAELAFAIQNESAITTIARTGAVDQRFREALAPRLAGRITAAFLGGKPAPSALTLATELGISPRIVSGVLEHLVLRGLLVETAAEEDEGYVPARDPDTITVVDLLVALRTGDEDASIPAAKGKLDERVDRILAGFEQAQRESVANHTLRELAQAAVDEGEGAPAETGALESRPARESLG